MKKETVITEFEDVMFSDFENYIGKKNVVSVLRTAFEDAMNAAARTINKMLDNNSRYRNYYNDSQLERIHDHCIRLAEVDFKWRSCENNIGRLILIGFAVSGIVDSVKELKETIEKEIKNKQNKEWDNWGEEYDD